MSRNPASDKNGKDPSGDAGGVMGECYMMSLERAKAVAVALKRLHPRQAPVIDEGLVRIYCVTEGESDAEAASPEWFESAPVDEIAAWIDVDKLLTRPAR
jgi:hypothetical protein